MNGTEIIKEEELDNKKVILRTVKINDIEYGSIILPHLTDLELFERYKRIKPIVVFNSLCYYLRDYSLKELRGQSYLWNAHNDIRSKVDLSNTEILMDFSCYHTYGYYGLFKPSIAEVLEQFPDEVLEEANAFYVLSHPEDIRDLNLEKRITEAGCHHSRVRALVIK